jgi:uncharacterized damage-inducible protein DinB
VDSCWVDETVSRPATSKSIGDNSRRIENPLVPDVEPEQPAPTRWTVATVYPDMWLDPDDDPRETDVEPVDERSTLVEFLRRYRLTLEMKCAGLDPEQLARRSVQPSTMSLLGLIRHMAEVECSWFRRIMAGQDAPSLYCTDQDRDGDWSGAAPDRPVVDEAWRSWRAEVSFAEEFVSGASDLEMKGLHVEAEGTSLRWVLVHMIEEYARHCGHADLLRERIDGRVGQ